MLTAQVSDRLIRLRDATREQFPPTCNPFETLWKNSWPRTLAALGQPGGRLPARRWADGFCSILAYATPLIFPDELIVGHLEVPAPSPQEQELLERAQQAGQALPPGTIDGHFGMDHDSLLTEGLLGLRERLEGYLADLSPLRGEENRRREYLLAARDCLDAALGFADRLAAEAAAQAAACSDPQRRAELEEIAAVCRHVPRHPARTFHEALQSVWCVHLLGRTENLLCAGRPDRTFWPFYQRDRESGLLTEERARELIGAFLIKFNQVTTTPQGAFLGGLDTEGRDTTNELSHLFLEMQGELELLNPGTCIGWNRHTPPDFFEKAVDYMCRGHAFPALFNDEVIIPSLIEAGVAPEDAVNYLNSTCVEISVQGCSGIRVVADYLSFPGMLLRALHNGRDVTEDRRDGPATGAPEDFPDFPALLAAVREQLLWALDENARRINAGLLGHPFARNYPFSSCFVRDCLARGRDWSDGGPLHNFAYPALVGLPNVVDGLLALEEIVYRRREMSLPEFVAIVDANFEGHEPLRLRLLNQMPKWGTNDDRADALARELVDAYYARVAQQRSHLDQGQFYPGFLCWVMHAALGSRTPATPDGRLARTAFADSLSAVQGRAVKGPTAEIASLSKLDFHGALGGMVYNLVLNRTVYDTAEGRGKLRDLLQTYLEQGGFEVQISVVNREMLLEARRRPEEHQHLMVKVGGYSDFFVALSPELQDALIAKSE